MKPSPKHKRWWLWLPLLALAFGLAVFGDKTPSGGTPMAVPVQAAPVSKPVFNTRPEPAKPKMVDIDNELEQPISRNTLILQGRAKSTTDADLFASTSWAPPPPAPSTAPAPPPTAPPLPFTFIGKKLEAGIWEVYLARGEQSYVVRSGSTIDGNYRVDQIAPPNLSLTYLPLAQSQNLSIGATE